MPTEEVTIRINTVMGSTKGMEDTGRAVAGKISAQTGQAVSQGMTNAIQDMSRKKEGGWKQIGKDIANGIGSVIGPGSAGSVGGLIGGGSKMLGMGAIAASVGAAVMAAQQVHTSMVMSSMGLHDGDGLRGHGIYGQIMGIKDWWTGRATKEAVQDLDLGQRGFRRSQVQEAGASLADQQMRTHGAMFTPITTADTFERAREERARLEDQQRDLAMRRGNVLNRMAAYQRNLDKGKFLDIDSGKRISREDALQQRAMLEQQAVQMQDSIRGIAGQQRDFEAGQLAMRKGVVFQGRQAYGAMTPSDREFVRDAAERMKSGEVLSPSELAAVQSQPHMQEQVQKYLEGRSDKDDGYNKFVKETGDSTYANAAEKTIRLGGRIEHYLDENKLLEQKQKFLQDITEAGNKARQMILDATQEAGQSANTRNLGRALIEDRTQQ